MSPLAPTRPRLDYGLGGALGGPCLVFVNGLGGLKESWYAQVVAFKDAHRVLTYNQRGIGGSQVLDQDASMRDFARDLVGLLNHLGIFRAVFVGVSFGGRVVQELALGWPGRALGVVLVSTSGGGPGHLDGDPRAGALLRRAASLSAEEWYEGLIPHLFGAAFRERHRDRLWRLARWWAAHPQSPVGLARQWQAWEGCDLWERLPELRAPTLVLHGTADSMSPPDNGRSLGERIPGARLELLEGLGHSPHAEDPRVFNELLAGFLLEQGLSGRGGG